MPKSPAPPTPVPTLRDQLSAFLDVLEQDYGLADVAGHAPLVLPSGEGDRLPDLAATFELSLFEQTVLTLALAQEVFPIRTRHLSAVVMGLGGDPMQATLTPYTCLTCFADADPGAFLEDAPLLRWALLHAGRGLTGDASLRTLTVAPGVLAYLQGHDQPDPEISGVVGELEAGTSLSRSQEALLAQAAKHLGRGEGERGLLLYGPDVAAMTALAVQTLRDGTLRGETPNSAALAGAAGQPARVLRVDLAAAAARPAEEVQALTRALGRDVRLKGFQLLLDATGQTPGGEPLDRLTETLLETAVGGAAVMAPEPMPLSTARALLPLEVLPPTPAEQRAQWAHCLGVAEDQPLLRQLGDQFQLGLDRIAVLAREARLALPGNASQAARTERAWEAARTANRRLMGGLATRVETRAGWDDLVLPATERGVLEQIAAHVRHRSQVYEDLGMARPGRGRSITALFSGPSGTGKTLSAEVLASDLNLDLYRIDLSSTVSKYIGETEKNLKKIFDAADQGGCILLFDEADSVFGKRAEVRDSNDRYANIQVNYLLQRLESFNGLALLTTNMESSMDVAFMRRIGFVLNFRPPQPQERERLWRGAFPQSLDTSSLDFGRLARAEVSGGNIRSVVMNAVFMAVSRAQPLDDALLTEALQLEYRKLGRLVLGEEERRA